MNMTHIKKRITKEVKELIEKSKGISLDIGCGQFKRKGSIGMDVRDVEGVDIVHDFNSYPWPIPDECANLITASHVIEHVPKWGLPPQVGSLVELLIKKKLLTRSEVFKHIGETEIFSFLIRFMDECWRISRVGGQLALALPYANSHGFNQDPTHAAPINESTFFYFDPEHQSALWSIYKPKPWKIEFSTYQVNGNIEVILSKRALLKKYE